MDVARSRGLLCATVNNYKFGLFAQRKNNVQSSIFNLLLKDISNHKNKNNSSLIKYLIMQHTTKNAQTKFLLFGLKALLFLWPTFN